jgi:predicted nuclease with TOPRIM domain
VSELGAALQRVEQLRQENNRLVVEIERLTRNSAESVEHWRQQYLKCDRDFGELRKDHERLRAALERQARDHELGWPVVIERLRQEWAQMNDRLQAAQDEVAKLNDKLDRTLAQLHHHMGCDAECEKNHP